ncbi:MAG: sulfurtransferase complex subunit TusB [Gammaproteobacteria bacterium]|nr:sulfurtransferase complex subunit TusB [Gammaproteobacteria bacterium]
MTALHLFNKTSLGAAAARVRNGDTVILIEDGCYAARAGGVQIKELCTRATVFAMRADLLARGIAESQLAAGVGVVDYDGFVAHCARCSPVVSWR